VGYDFYFTKITPFLFIIFLASPQINSSQQCNISYPIIPFRPNSDEELLVDLSHTIENGKDVSEMSLKSFAELEAVVIRVPYNETLEITEEHLKNREIRNRAVLIYTGWDEHWNTERYYNNHPYLTESAPEYLKSCAVKLVGIDSYNIDYTAGKTRPVHSILRGAQILIVEHLCNLELLPDQNFTFTAAPPKFKGVGTFPVRAFAFHKKIYGEVLRKKTLP
jgi:kynurenine formamidase